MKESKDKQVNVFITKEFKILKLFCKNLASIPKIMKHNY